MNQMNMDEVLKEGSEELKFAGVLEADLDAWYLLEAVTGISRASYLCDRDRALTKEEIKKYQKYITQRAERRPLQYILGEQKFMGFSFLVDEHVLIPRQDTEVLVEEALKYTASRGKVLDLCTGSGCIIISLKLLAGCEEAVGADISGEALSLAKRNAKRNGADITFVESDMFSAIQGRFDLIVSNPPYIRTDDIDALEPEVRSHEPQIALDGKEDGLFFYHILARDISNFLNPNGVVLFEIGCDQGIAVSALLKERGFQQIEVIKDLAGLDRVVKGVR